MTFFGGHDFLVMTFSHEFESWFYVMSFFLLNTSFTRVTCLIHTCDVKQSHTTKPQCAHTLPWLTSVCDMTHWYVRHTSCIRVTWLIHTCANKFMCVLWCVHMCDTTHSDVWRDSMICATYVHTSDMTHPSMRSHMTHSSVLYAALMSLHWSVYMFATPPPCRLSSVRYTHQSELSLQGGKHVDWSDWTAQSTGWRTCIGCLKLQVSFRKRAINHRALLLEMTCKDKASCATLYPHLSSAVHSSVYTLQMTHASVMYTRVTWLIPQSGQTWLIHQSCIRVTWLIPQSHVKWVMHWLTWLIHQKSVKWVMSLGTWLFYHVTHLIYHVTHDWWMSHVTRTHDWWMSHPYLGSHVQVCTYLGLCVWECVIHDSFISHVWQIPLKLLHPQTPPNPETQISR